MRWDGAHDGRRDWMSGPALLSVRNLTVAFETRRGSFDAVRDVSFDVQPGQTLGVVGESGSGKSVTAMALMQLLPEAARVTSGVVRFGAQDLGRLTERQMRSVRGREIALSCGPKLLIADEPTTALDVTTQAQILDLLRDLQQRLHMSVLLITHDLGVVAAFADDVMVMYAGRVVERAPVVALFERPGHPYAEGLLGSMPPLEDDDTSDTLAAIEGNVASPFAMPSVPVLLVGDHMT